MGTSSELEDMEIGTSVGPTCRWCPRSIRHPCRKWRPRRRLQQQPQRHPLLLQGPIRFREFLRTSSPPTAWGHRGRSRPPSRIRGPENYHLHRRPSRARGSRPSALRRGSLRGRLQRSHLRFGILTTRTSTSAITETSGVQELVALSVENASSGTLPERGTETMPKEVNQSERSQRPRQHGVPRRRHREQWRSCRKTMGRSARERRRSTQSMDWGL